MAKNYKKLHGRSLVDAGYMLVPIKAGEKHPGAKKWPDIRAEMDDVEKWSNSSYYGGLGVLGKFNPGIDIDVYNRETVELLIKWCMENIGVAPVRVGNAPRVLIPYAAPTMGLYPMRSEKYEDELGNFHEIDVRAEGQQWVAYGIHPTTKNPYTWEGGELHSIESDFLPVLNGEKMQALFKYFDSIIPDGWEKISRGKKNTKMGGVVNGEVVGAGSFENFKPPLNLTTDKIQSYLDQLSPDGEVNGMGWRTVGMALYHQYEGSDEGKQLFIDWSLNSVDYNYDEIEARWPSWGANTYGGEAVTMATVISMYNEVTESAKDPTLVKKSKKLSDWEKRFVMVDLAESSEVHDAGLPIHKVHRSTLKAFREQNTAYLHQTLSPDGELQIEAMVDAWQGSKNTRHYKGYTYQPGRARFCRREHSYGDEALFVNNFYFPPHSDIMDKDSIEPFFKFLAHLFPEKIEREWFVEWMARLIQYPHVRSFVTPINISNITGTGRGLLFEILRKVVGAHNTHDVSADDMEGRFNGFLDTCLIAVVQEIKANAGAKKYQSWERMKSLLTDTTANIQAKGKDSYTATIYANFLMFSNNIDALPIQDVNERRINATRGADRPIGDREIKSIVAWFETPDNVASLFNYLKAYRVNLDHFNRAPVSETKRQMVSAAMGLGGSELSSWLKEEAPAVFDFEFAQEALEKFSDGEWEEQSLSREQFGRSLLDKGFHVVQIRPDGIMKKRVYFNPSKTDGNLKNLKDIYNSEKLLD